MSNNFITNKKILMSDVINKILPKTPLVDILVGYFYFSGFSELSDNLKDKKIRILVGLEVDIHINKYVQFYEYENNDHKRSNYEIKDDFYKSFVKLFNETDFADDESKLSQVELFFDKISNGSLEIKKTSEPCHSKLYLFHYSEDLNECGDLPGVLITGSSNLSYQGLRSRLELNARFNDKNDFEEGVKIFDELWKQAIDIVDQSNVEEWKNKVINNIWYEKCYSPYLMYIRVMDEYFSLIKSDSLAMPSDITGGKFQNLKYQTDAIYMAYNALKNHNGAIVADVVGLGKSIIAATVARNMQLKTIVICPPHLINQWTLYKTEFGCNATVFSVGKINDALEHYRELSEGNGKFLIIVDEAHRFRNEFTQAYTLLHNLCLGNKVLLLTATPFNNNPLDIYSLIKLFQIPSLSTLHTVDDLEKSFMRLKKSYEDLNKENKKDKSSNKDKVKKQISSIAKEIRSIIAPIVIRRSRLDLKEIKSYSDDIKQQGIELTIPTDPVEFTYDLSSIRDLYLSTLEEISKSDDNSDIQSSFFKGARYKPSSYIKPELSKKLEEELEEKIELLKGRQANIAKFMRHLLVRRFESSVAAFQQSLKYMISSSEQILKWINVRNKVPIYKKGNLPDVDSLKENTDDSFDAYSEFFEKYENKGFFEIDMKYINDTFLKDLKSDLDLLNNLHERWFGDNNHIEKDPKLNSFIKIISNKIKKEPKRKIIVFSEFADTVNYLGTKLQEAGLPVMKYTSADAQQKNRDLIRANFDAGLALSEQRNDYSILVATDAISEGYSLHRAGAIVNYDIPYNPTRVIQRIGRINRINKKVFNELYIWNYFPSDVGEGETRTRQISTLKMAMIQAIMGEDTKALTKDEEVHAFFKDSYKNELDNSESISWDTPYLKQLNELKGTKIYDDALRIPHRAKIGRNVQLKQHGVLIFGKKGNDYVFKLGNENLDTKFISAEDAFELIRTDESEESTKLSNNFYKIYNKVKDSLFETNDRKEHDPSQIKATEGIKIIKKKQLLDSNYCDDLMDVIALGSLSALELKLIINVSKSKEVEIKKLKDSISHEYLKKILELKNSVTDVEETVILAEELREENGF